MKISTAFLALMIIWAVSAQAQWTKCGDSNGGSVYSLAVSGTTLFAGTRGAGVWKAEISNLNPLSVAEIVESAKLIVYPTPANEEINIILPDAAQTTIPAAFRLLTPDGRIIREFADVDIMTGQITLPVEGIESGVYALALHTGPYYACARVLIHR